MPRTATAFAAAPSAQPLHQHPSAFQGDGEGMVDLLVDACVTAKEAQRQAALAAGGSPPRAGRDLVPYFNPGSTDWGLEDVNGATADVDGDSSFDGSSRGYDSSSSTGVRQRASKVEDSRESEPKSSALLTKSRKNSKRGKKLAPLVDKDAARTAAAAALQSAPPPLPPSKQLTKFAGTTFGLASPEPESVPMPSSALLSGSVTRKTLAPAPAPSLHHEATKALRGLLQLEATAVTSFMALNPVKADRLFSSPGTPVMV
mmetsp:Transcript_6566/g.17027  ORF Transcript_6566/g.17027 Transcript_6566/m.17027 type:complete len:259 (-) Transcript_6566:914-1690(-)